MTIEATTRRARELFQFLQCNEAQLSDELVLLLEELRSELYAFHSIGELERLTGVRGDQNTAT